MVALWVSQRLQRLGMSYRANSVSFSSVFMTRCLLYCTTNGKLYTDERIIMYMYICTTYSQNDRHKLVVM